jgi:hypothetical protein
MDTENTTIVAESGDYNLDSVDFSKEWNDEGTSGGWDDEPAEVEDTADQPEAETTEDTTEPAPKETETKQDEKPTEADQLFELKHLDEVKSVTRDEVIALAQKGLDYDRIRDKAKERDDYRTRVEELETEVEKHSEYLAFLQELAAPRNMTIDQIMDEIRINALEKQGINRETAKERVKIDKEKRAEFLKSERAKKEQDWKAAKAKERQDKEINEFLEAYPDYKSGKKQFNELPDEIKSNVGKDKSLLRLVMEHEIKQLKAERDQAKSELEAEKKNKENKAKSAGSQATSGNSKQMDDYMKDWYSD